MKIVVLAGVNITASNNNDWTYSTIDKYFDILSDYIPFKDIMEKGME